METAVKNLMPDLHSASVSDNDFFGNVIDYTRPLNEYPTAQTIIDYLRQNKAKEHVYTEFLNKDGKVIQDSMEKYLDNDALSSSMLKAARKTPLHFHFAKSEDKEELEKIKGTPGYLNIGTYLHQCLLEPTKFSRAIVEPDHPLNSTEGVTKAISFWEKLITEKGYGIIGDEEVNTVDILDHCSMLVTDQLGLSLDKIDGKRAYVAALKKCADVEPVSEENFLKIQILQKHVDAYGNGIINTLLKRSKREVSVYYNDPETGLDLKVRPDALQFKENIGVDAIISVKTTACEDLNAFYAHTAKLNYDLSEGMYQDVVSKATGRDFNTTITIMLQTSAPFAIAVLVWSPEDIEMGKHKYNLALHNAKEIIEKGSSKGYDVFAESDNYGLIQMQLPGWNQREELPQNI